MKFDEDSNDDDDGDDDEHNNDENKDGRSTLRNPMLFNSTTLRASRQNLKTQDDNNSTEGY